MVVIDEEAIKHNLHNHMHLVYIESIQKRARELDKVPICQASQIRF